MIVAPPMPLGRIRRAGATIGNCDEPVGQGWREADLTPEGVERQGGRAARISPQENIDSQTDGLFRVDQRVCPVEPRLKDACIEKPAEVQRCDPRMGILAVLCSPLVGKAVEKFDPRLIVFLGILGLAAIMVWRMWSFSNDVTFLQIAWPTLVTGVFMVMFFVPVTGLTMASVDPEEQANAAGLSNFMRTLAGAFATSLVQSGWSDATRANNTEIVNSMRHGQAAVDAMTAQGMPDEAARTMLSYVVEGQSVMLATLGMFGVIAVCLGISAAIIWLSQAQGPDRYQRRALTARPAGTEPTSFTPPTDSRHRLSCVGPRQREKPPSRYFL